MNTFFISFILLIAPIVCAYAVPSDSTKDTTIVLKEVVIVTAQRMKANASSISDAITVIDRKAIINLSPMSTPDVMASMAGVWMQKTNHGGGSPFIRGLTGYHTLLLTDGIRFNNSTFRSGPNQYLNTIDPLTLQGIEVLRGQGSVQYGSDAIGGVAQLFFREPEFTSAKKPEAIGRVYTQYMNHNMEYSGRTELEIRSEGFALLCGLSLKKLDDIKAGGNLGVLKPTGYDVQSYDIKTKVKTANTLFTALWQHVIQHDVPLYHQLVTGKYNRYHFDIQQRDVGYIRAESYYKSKLLSQVRYTVAYLHSLEKRTKQRIGNPIVRYEGDRVNTYHAAAEFLSDCSSHWKASSGVEFYQDQIKSVAEDNNQQTKESITARGLYPDDTFYLNLAAFSFHTIDIKRFNISVGGRYNLIRMNVMNEVFGRTHIKPEALVGHGGVVFKAHKKMHLLANASTGFRAPNVNDVATFGVADYRYEVPNYKLAPEKSFQFQTGIRTQFKKWKGEIFLYQNKLTDLISPIPSSYNDKDSLDGLQVYKKENVNRAHIKGIETEVAFQPSAWFTTLASLTYTVGENLSKNEPLSRIPPLFGRVTTEIKFNSEFMWRIEFIAASMQDRLSGGDKLDSRIALGGTPAWTVLNTSIAYNKNNFRINTGIQNIFNKTYRIHGSGVDGIGRSLFISLMVEFPRRD